MLTDARAVPPDGVVEADVCVVGGGPAGITVAVELARQPLRVCLLEGGGFEPDERAQALAASRTVSHHHHPDALSRGRRRQFGGTSALWLHRTEPGNARHHARTFAPEPLDLERRAAVEELPGWPLDVADLRPFYERAQWHWNRGPFAYDDMEAWKDPDAEPIEFPDGEVATRVCQYGPSDVFSLRYRDDLLEADNVDVFLWSDVVELEPATTGGVGRVRVSGPDGHRFWVRAKAFVLAGGCVENVQLLLADGERLGAAGAGHDLIGRFVTDHQEYRLGVIVPDTRAALDRIAFYDIRSKGGLLFSGVLTLAEDVKRKHELLNLSAMLVPQPAGFASEAERSAKALAALRRRELPDDLLGHVRSIASQPWDALASLRLRTIDRARLYREFRGGWSAAGVDRGQFGVIEVIVATEQTPSPDNRFVLDTAADPLGRRRVRLQWTWTDADKANLGRSQGLLAEAFARARLGDLVRWAELDGPGRPVYPAIHHPMGGLRMHADARRGVVDADCRVHGVDNLFVTGAAVFPTGLGYANPTLTVLALAIRLADHLKHQLG
jgi:choline dehydrogenase-like flavoprotein